MKQYTTGSLAECILDDMLLSVGFIATVIMHALLLVIGWLSFKQFRSVSPKAYRLLAVGHVLGYLNSYLVATTAFLSFGGSILHPCIGDRIVACTALFFILSVLCFALDLCLTLFGTHVGLEVVKHKINQV